MEYVNVSILFVDMNGFCECVFIICVYEWNLWIFSLLFINMNGICECIFYIICFFLFLFLYESNLWRFSLSFTNVNGTCELFLSSVYRLFRRMEFVNFIFIVCLEEFFFIVCVYLFRCYYARGVGDVLLHIPNTEPIFWPASVIIIYLQKTVLTLSFVFIYQLNGLLNNSICCCDWFYFQLNVLILKKKINLLYLINIQIYLQRYLWRLRLRHSITKVWRLLHCYI